VLHVDNILYFKDKIFDFLLEWRERQQQAKGPTDRDSPIPCNGCWVLPTEKSSLLSRENIRFFFLSIPESGIFAGSITPYFSYPALLMAS
jgi:hypothetical protein